MKSLLSTALFSTALLVSTFVFAAGTTVAQDNSSQSTTEKAVATQTAHSIDVTVKMNYLLHLPADYKPKSSGDSKRWPLMIFLHGAGERGTDLNQVKLWGPPKRVASQLDFPFVLISPQCPRGIYWNTDHVNHLVDTAIAEHNIDPDRVYLTGLSMGGYGTWELAAKHPNKFAAIAPICGKGDPETGARLTKLPIWAFHGDADNVVPLNGSTKIIEAIKAAGGTNAKLTIYKGVGHNSWSQTYANPELYKWLLKQKRHQD